MLNLLNWYFIKLGNDQIFRYLKPIYLVNLIYDTNSTTNFIINFYWNSLMNKIIMRKIYYFQFVSNCIKCAYLSCVHLQVYFSFGIETDYLILL